MDTSRPRGRREATAEDRPMDLRRLRTGEVIAGLAGLVLGVALFALPWFSAGDGATATGWSAMDVLRFVVVIAALGGLALAVAQATQASPALPVSLSVVMTAVGAVTTIALVIRLLTTAGTPQSGAYVGLAAAVALTAGAFASLRQESGWTPGAEHPIPTVPLGPPDAG
jgi:hypothetical protein